MTDSSKISLKKALKTAAHDAEFVFPPTKTGSLCKGIDVNGIVTCGSGTTSTHYIRVVHEGKKLEIVHEEIHKHGWDFGPWKSLEETHTTIDKLVIN